MATSPDTVDEDMPPVPDNDYARVSAAGELNSRGSHSESRSSVVILRPSIIYGPFSEGWTIRYAKAHCRRQVAGTWQPGEGTSNLIHARDVAGAIRAAD